jgi:uncharacterized protein (DUF2141 family)
MMLAAAPIAATPADAQAIVGPDAAACRAGGPALLVNVTGFKNQRGRLRVNVYGSKPADFLAKGKYVRRVDVPLSGSGRMRVCVKLPKAGDYAVAVRHDADANGKSGWSDGGGFSRNPDISLANLRPKYGQVAIPVSGVKSLNVVLNYRRGLSIAPINEN